MYDSCANCKNLLITGENKLYPYRCRKDKPGVTHSQKWFDKVIREQAIRPCEHHESLIMGGEREDLK